MPPKRPLGLSKAAKASKASEPDAKRLKSSTGEQDTTEAQSIAEEWDDLQELLARAVKAFGLDAAGSLPLFRGVLHECDRITRNYSEESIAQLSAPTASTEARPLDAHSNFYALFADALIHSGVIIGRSPDLIMEGEPDSAEAYFQAARDLFDKNQREKEGGFGDPRSQFTWGSTLLLLADVKAADVPRVGDDAEGEEYEDDDDEEEDEEKAKAKKTEKEAPKEEGPGGADSEEGKEVIKLLKAGVFHYDSAYNLCPAVSPAGEVVLPSTTPGSSTEESEESSTLVPLTQSRIALSVATQLLDISEDQLPRSMRPPWLLAVKNTLAKAELSVAANDSTIQAGIAKAAGRHQLAAFALALPPDWEDLGDLSGLAGEDEATALALQAVDSLEKAKTISDSVTFVNTLQLPFEADDLAERLHYAYTIMINLENDDERAEAWMLKSQALGFLVSVDDEDEEDDDEEGEEE